MVEAVVLLITTAGVGLGEPDGARGGLHSNYGEGGEDNPENLEMEGKFSEKENLEIGLKITCEFGEVLFNGVE